MTIQSINVGNVNILSISDCLMAVDACDFFPHKTVDAFRGFEGHVDDDCQVNGGINVASFLLESQGKRILVDAGLGPSPVAEAGGAAGNLLSEMRQGGIDPDHHRYCGNYPSPLRPYRLAAYRHARRLRTSHLPQRRIHHPQGRLGPTIPTRRRTENRNRRRLLPTRRKNFPPISNRRQTPSKAGQPPAGGG